MRDDVRRVEAARSPGLRGLPDGPANGRVLLRCTSRARFPLPRIGATIAARHLVPRPLRTKVKPLLLDTAGAPFDA
jgi:hypothetical protein